MHLVILVGGNEQIWAAFLAGEARRPGIGADHNSVTIGHRFEDRLQDIGKDRADNESDLVALDHGLDLVHRGIRFQFVILHDQLGLDAAELPPQMLQGKIESGALLLTDYGGRAR